MTKQEPREIGTTFEKREGPGMIGIYKIVAHTDFRSIKEEVAKLIGYRASAPVRKK